MNLQIHGNHIEVTPALRGYVAGKLERIERHFYQVISNVVIGSDVSIGNGCKIQNNVSVFKGVTLGRLCFLWSFDGIYQCLQSAKRNPADE